MHTDSPNQFRSLLEYSPAFLDRVNTPRDHVPDLEESNQHAYNRRSAADRTPRLHDAPVILKRGQEGALVSIAVEGHQTVLLRVPKPEPEAAVDFGRAQRGGNR